MGLEDGWWLGFSEGSELGAPLGDADGVALGTELGFEDGPLLGFEDGVTGDPTGTDTSPNGIIVGTSVGDVAGITVGTTILPNPFGAPVPSVLGSSDCNCVGTPEGE